MPLDFQGWFLGDLLNFCVLWIDEEMHKASFLFIIVVDKLEATEVAFYILCYLNTKPRIEIQKLLKDGNKCFPKQMNRKIYHLKN